MKLNKSGEPNEESIQISVFDWLRLYPDIYDHVYHFANESKRSPRYGATLKKMGLKRGVSDIFIALPFRGFIGAWIEIKTKEGRATKEQLDFLEKMEKLGYFTALTKGLEETFSVISWYIEKRI